MATNVFLRITCEKTGNTKTLEFDDSLRVFDIYEKLNEKFDLKSQEKFMLYRPLKKQYLSPGRTLYSYEFANEETLVYKSPMRIIKVKMSDHTIKTYNINESEPISKILDTILDNLNINIDSKEEYGIIKEEPEQETPKVQKRNSAARFNFLYSANTKWLDITQTLCYEDIGLDDVLILRKKLFYTDERLNRNDDVQINLIYSQIRENIVSGANPCTLEEAILLAAIQCQIQFGDYDPEKIKNNIINVEQCLPFDYRKQKKVEKLIADEYYKLKGLTELNGKYKYVQMCRSLKTYGTTFFYVKEKNSKKKNKVVPVLLGITKNSVIRVNPDTKEVMEEWPLKQLKRWVFTPTTFTIEFGAYKQSDYVVETDQGVNIAKLINDYIKLLTKTKAKNEKRDDDNDIMEYATVVESDAQNVVTQHKVEIEVKKVNIEDYIDILNNALMYLNKAEECILQSYDEGNNVYTDKTYYENYKMISNNIDTTIDNIKKLGALSKDDDIEGLCNKILNIATIIEEITTLVVFNSRFLTTNNIAKNPKVKDRESSLLIKNYYFNKNMRNRDSSLRQNSIYSVQDSSSICSSFRDNESLTRDDSSNKSFDVKSIDVKNISNNDNYKLISDKIFLPDNYKITAHSRYIIESLKEAIINNNESQRYTLFSIDTRVVIELLNKLKILIYENIPGKSDCNAFIKKISEVKKKFTQLQDSIINEVIEIEGEEKDENNDQFDERYIEIINAFEKSSHTVYDLSKENYISMINDLKQLHDQFCELYSYSYKVCFREYKEMNTSNYLKKYMIFLNTLSLYANNLKRMYGDYSNLTIEDNEAYDNVYSELQSYINLLKQVPKLETKDDKKEVVEALTFYKDILSDSDIDRLNKLIEILNNCPKLSDISPENKNGEEDFKKNITKLQTLSNFMIILCKCMIDIYNFYNKLDIQSSDDNSEIYNDDDSNICEIEYDKKDKVILFDMLENLTFKYSDVIIELSDLLNNEEIKHSSGNLFSNEAELYLGEIKDGLLQVIDNEKKIINNEERHKNVWDNNIIQCENIQSVLFNLLAHLPLHEKDKNDVIYIIYKLQSIIKDLEENITLSDSFYLNPVQRSPDFIESHKKIIIQGFNNFNEFFNDFITSSLSEKMLLGAIIKVVHIFEIFIIMYKTSVYSLTYLDKKKQNEILNSAKNTAISLNNIIIDKLGLTEQDLEDMSLYMDDYADFSKYEEKLNISEHFNDDLIEEFKSNMKILEENLKSTIKTKNILTHNINSLYLNINDIIENVKAVNQNYTVDINDFETECTNLYQNVDEFNTNYSETTDQIKIYKMSDFLFSFYVFSKKMKSINTINDICIKEAKNEIFDLYNSIAQINIKLKVDIISLIDENREVNNSLWKSVINEILNIITKMKDICEKAKEQQSSLYISPKIQKLNNIQNSIENILKVNSKEIDILNRKEFYGGNGENGDAIYYIISNALCSIHIYVMTLISKSLELFNLSCNSPMEDQMYSLNDNWCDLIVNYLNEINDTIKSLSSIIQKNHSYIKNINIYNTLKKLYEILISMKYLSTKKFINNNNYEIWSEVAADNAIRCVATSIYYLQDEILVPTSKLNMMYVYSFYITFALFLSFALI